MCARDQSSIFSIGGKFCPDYGLLLELHALILSRLFLCTLAYVYHWLTFLGDGDTPHCVSAEGWRLRVRESQVFERGSLWVSGCGRVHSNVPPTGVGGRPMAPQAWMYIKYVHVVVYQNMLQGAISPQTHPRFLFCSFEGKSPKEAKHDKQRHTLNLMWP